MGAHRVVAVIAVLAGLLALASVAHAGTVRLTTPVVERSQPFGDTTAHDYGYVGPPTTDWPGKVGGWNTSSDTYVCPHGQKNTGLVVVGDEEISNDRAFMVSSGGARQTEFSVAVTNWSGYGMHYRVAASCTDSTRAYALFHLDGCNASGHCFPLGDYRDLWASLLRGAVDRMVGDREYAALIPTAFCWNRGCAPASAARVGSRARAAVVRAQPGGNRFGLSNGANRISLRFAHPRGSRRPPSIRVSGASRCRAERMHTAVHDGAGRLDLVLVCRGLEPAGAVRLTVARAVTRSFRLRRNGAGSMRVRLKRPPGKVEPYLHVTYGRSSTPCRDVGHAVRLGATTVEVLVDARCGRAARGATAHLHIGGLLAGSPTT